MVCSCSSIALCFALYGDACELEESSRPFVTAVDMDWVHIIAIAIVSLATVMLATVVVQTLLAREALSRLAQMNVATAFDFDAKPPESLRSCVRSYGIVVDLASTSAVERAMGGSPPPQQDSALFACEAGSVESLVGSYSDVAWMALQSTSSDAAALYEDLANERVRYLMVAGTYLRAWAWRELPGRRGSFDVADRGGDHLRPTEVDLDAPARPGYSMPGVEAGTLVLVVARIDSLNAPHAVDMPSTSMCRASSSPPSPVPIEFPILASQGSRNAWDQLVGVVLSRDSGTLPLHVWGFGGRATF